MSDSDSPKETSPTSKAETTVPELPLDQQLKRIIAVCDQITSITDGWLPDDPYDLGDAGGYSAAMLSNNQYYSGFIGISDTDNANFTINKRRENRGIETIEVSLIGEKVQEKKLVFMHAKGGKWGLDPRVHPIAQPVSPQTITTLFTHCQAVGRLVYGVQESIPRIGLKAVLDPKITFTEPYLAQRLNTLLQYGVSVTSANIPRRRGISAPLGYRNITLHSDGDGTTCEMIRDQPAGEDDRVVTIMHSPHYGQYFRETLICTIKEGEHEENITFARNPSSMTWILVDTKKNGHPVPDNHWGADLVNSLYFPARSATEALRFFMPS